MVGGGCQIVAMMILFPVLRRFMDTIKIFYTCFGMAVTGYILIIIISATGTSSVVWLFIPAALIMAAVGVLNVIITIFLANTVDYGEFKNNRRDESVIFSMQTFVVKLASGIARIYIFDGFICVPYQFKQRSGSNGTDRSILPHGTAFIHDDHSDRCAGDRIYRI